MISVVVAVAVVVLAGCGSSSKSPSAAATTVGGSAAVTSTTVAGAATTVATTPAGNFDSCSVVTQAQAASAIGAPVTAGVLGTATVEGGLACVFYGASAPTPHTPDVAQSDTVRVVVVKGPDAVTWYNDYKSKVHPQAITGYGDQAYYDGIASFSALKGSAYLRIAVSPAGAAPSLPDEEHLATTILPLL